MGVPNWDDYPGDPLASGERCFAHRGAGDDDYLDHSVQQLGLAAPESREILLHDRERLLRTLQQLRKSVIVTPGELARHLPEDAQYELT